MAANIRFATEADIPVILEFIHALAAYENMEDQVIVTPELLKEWVFQKKKSRQGLRQAAVKAPCAAHFAARLRQTGVGVPRLEHPKPQVL